jgi:hypothetical protein
MNFKKIIFAITLLFSSLFVGLGYAALTQELSIGGTIDSEPPKKVGFYISNVEVSSSSNTQILDHKIFSPTILSTEFNINNGGSITFKVTVTNDTNLTYWYDELQYIPDNEDNSYIQDSVITIITKDKENETTLTFDSHDWVPALSSRDYYVTYTSNRTLSNIKLSVNFHFENRLDFVHDEFSELLNNPTSYEILSNAFNENYAETGSTVLGNVGDDKALFDQLFGENLTLNVDGVEKPVTIMIQREDVNNSNSGDNYEPSGPKGCEYTIYITTDNVDVPGSKPTVYAITYTQNDQGEWHQIAQLYEGTALSEDYDLTNSTYDGAFDVDTWRATAKVYELAPGIDYNVGYQNGDQYDIIKTLEDLMTVKDQNFFNEIDNQKIMKKAYDILKANEGSNAPEVVALREAFEAAKPYFVNYNNGQEFKVNRSYTRAEIIGYIVDIIDAMNYFEQTS